MMPHVVLLGKPTEKQKLYGPFKTHEDAMYWAEDLDGCDWWVLPVHKPFKTPEGRK
jgi:hypothetical protein